MNQATKKASGVKPSHLSNVVPEADVIDASQDGVDKEIEALAKNNSIEELQRQFLASQKSASLSPTPIPEALPPGGSPVPPEGIDYSPGIDPAMAANVVEQGLPTAVSAAGTAIGGYLAGGSTAGIGTGAGMRLGNMAASAFNVALAPQYKKIADAIREHYNIPIEQKGEVDQMVQMAASEIFSIAGTRFLAQQARSVDKVGKALASSEVAGTVAKNLQTMDAAKESGIDLGAQAFTKGTTLEPQVDSYLSSQMGKGLGSNPAFDAQNQRLVSMKSAFDDFKNTVGSTVDKDGVSIIRPDTISAKKDIVGAKLGDIRKTIVSATDDKKVDVDPVLNSLSERLKGHGLLTDGAKLTTEQLNSLAPESRAIAAKYNQAINSINLSTTDKGKRQISLTQLQELVNSIGDGANFASRAERTPVEKQLGSIYKEVSAVRDEAYSAALVDLASQAEKMGNSTLAKRYNDAAAQMKNLSSDFSRLSKANTSFAKAIENDPKMATEYFFQNLNTKDYDNLLKGLEPEAKGALSNAYLQNLIDSASNDSGVLVNTQAMRSAIEKHASAKGAGLRRGGGRVEQLMGKEDYNRMLDWLSVAESSQKLEAKGVGLEGASNQLAKLFSTIKSSSMFDYAQSLLWTTPKIKNLVENTPAYRQAFERYYLGNKTDQFLGSSKIMTAEIAAKAAPKAAMAIYGTNRDENKRDIRALELQFLKGRSLEKK